MAEIIKGVCVFIGTFGEDTYRHVSGDLEVLPTSNDIILHLENYDYSDDDNFSGLTTLRIPKDKILFYGILAKEEDEDAEDSEEEPEEKEETEEEQPKEEKVSLLKKLFGGV